MNSVTQLRIMLEALKDSPEPQEIKDIAKKTITGVIGHLRQKKKKKQDALARHVAELRAIEHGIQAENPVLTRQYYGASSTPHITDHGDASVHRPTQHGASRPPYTNGYGPRKENRGGGYPAYHANSRY